MLVIGADLRIRSSAAGQENQEPDPADWMKVLDEFSDQVVANGQLFVLHERDHNAFEEFEQSEHHKAEHDYLGAQLRRTPP